MSCWYINSSVTHTGGNTDTRCIHLTRGEGEVVPFILPGVLVTTLLILYPLFYTIPTSFSTNAMGKGGLAGLTNYIRLFRNPLFLQTILNTVKWTLQTAAVSFLIGCTLATTANYKGVVAKGFSRSLVLIARIVPDVVKATVWKWLFAADGRMANRLLLSLGVIKKAIPWPTSPKYAMTSIIIVQIWACAPYVMLVMTAGISQLSTDLCENANLDGASWLQELFCITMPLLKGISFICILMLSVWAVDEFSLIWIVTSGGQNTGAPSLLAYNQFKVLNLDFASTSVMMQLLITMIFAILHVKFMVKED